MPPPKFADPERARKLAAAFPEIEKLFDKWFTERHVPGAVFGIIIDGELAWVRTVGVRETKSHALAKHIAADNLFLDVAAEVRAARSP